MRSPFGIEKTRKVLITGGAGFIGSHLAERFLNDGCKVVIMDNISTGSLQNIRHIQSSPHFSLFTDSVLDKVLVSELVNDCDVVFHLAGTVGVRLILENPLCCIQTNVHGTETVLAAATTQRKRVIIASTSEVYGKSTDLPFREDADTIMGPVTNSRWAYACSKIMTEIIGLAHWQKNLVPITIVRLFNTVGPRQSDRYGMVVPTFLSQALRNAPLTVYGSGEQTRCFAYVQEVVECLVRIANAPQTVEEVINVGNNQEISMKALAVLIKDITGSRSDIHYAAYDVAYQPGFEDVNRRVPCLAKVEALLGFRPRMPIEVIIRQMEGELRTPLQ